MAAVSELNVRLGLLYKDFDRSLGQVERSLRASGRRLASLGSDLSTAVSLPLLGIGAYAIRSAGDLESLRLAMETTMKASGHSIEEATKELEALRAASLAPGIDFEQAILGSIRLQGVGFEAERARQILVQLANAIALTGGSSEELNGVTRQFTQMISKGRVLQEDLTIILENMPAIGKALDNAFGTRSADNLRELGVTSEQLIAGVTAEFEKLPRVAGGIKNAIVNFFTGLKTTAAAFGEEINKAFNIEQAADAIIGRLKSLVDAFSRLDDGTKRTIIQFGIFAAALGPALKILGTFYGTAAQAVSVLRSLAAMSAPMTAFFAGMTSSTSGLIEYTKNWISTMTGAGQAAMRMRLAVLAATGGLAVILLGIGAAVFALTDRFDAAATATEIFAKAKAETIAQTAKETAALNQNFDVLRNVHTSTEQRKQAIDALKGAYPDYLRGLDLEKASNKELTEIQKGLNDQILRGVAERQKAAAITGLYEEQAKILLRIQEIQRTNSITTNEATLIDTGDWIEAGSRVGAVVKKLQEQVADLGKQADITGGDFDRAFGLAARSVDPLLEAEYRARQAAEDARDALTDMGQAAKKVPKIVDAPISDGSAKRMANALASVNRALAGFDEKVKLYGETTTTADERTKLLGSSIEKLLKAGFSAGSAEVEKLKSELDASESSTQAAIEAYKALRDLWSKPVDIQVPVPAVPTIAIRNPFADMTEGVSQGATDMANALLQVTRAVEAFDRDLQASGDTAGAAENRVRLLAASVQTLLRAGYAESSPEVRRLTDEIERSGAASQVALDRYKALAANLPTVGDQGATISIGMQVQGLEALESLNAAFDAAKQVSLDYSQGTASVQELTAAYEGLVFAGITPAQAAMRAMEQGLYTFGEVWDEVMGQIHENTSVLGQAVMMAGDAMMQAASSGATSLAELGKAAAGAAAKVVRAWIQQGVAAAVAKALSGVPFPFNLAAGAVAGAAAATLFSAAISKIGVPALAAGGVVNQPTLAMIGEYPGARNNPEIVAPEKKLREIFAEGGGAREMYSVIRGDDLLLTTDKAAARRGRVR